jgi:hypothetical protein
MSKGDFSNLGRKQKTEAFIEKASVDGNSTNLNPKAKRDFKAIRLALNEYEYDLLTKASLDANLSLVAYIRTSWMNRAKKT